MNENNDNSENFEYAQKLIKDGFVEADPEKLALWIEASKNNKLKDSKLDLVDLLLLD